MSDYTVWALHGMARWACLRWWAGRSWRDVKSMSTALHRNVFNGKVGGVHVVLEHLRNLGLIKGLADVQVLLQECHLGGVDPVLLKQDQV